MDRSPPESEPQLRLPESSSLVVLLVFFAGIAIISLISIIASEDAPRHSQLMPDKAYSPEDITDVEFEFEPLPGLTEATDKAYTLPPPPFSDPDIFPCSSCHEEGDYDATRRELAFHEEIQLNHGPRDRWCFDCHNPENRDVLRLSSGRTVSFEESYELCGQCHGTIYRDWKQGIHGRRRGYWNGAKSYLLCAHCHNPHSPRPAPIEPLPPPIHPSYLASDLQSPEEGSASHE